MPTDQLSEFIKDLEIKKSSALPVELQNYLSIEQYHDVFTRALNGKNRFIGLRPGEGVAFKKLSNNNDDRSFSVVRDWDGKFRVMVDTRNKLAGRIKRASKDRNKIGQGTNKQGTCGAYDLTENPPVRVYYMRPKLDDIYLNPPDFISDLAKLPSASSYCILPIEGGFYSRGLKGLRYKTYFKFAPLGDLGCFIKNNPSLRAEQKWQLQESFLQCINFFQQHDVIHADLYPSNILVFENDGKLSVMITDFDVSLFVRDSDTKYLGGAAFGMPPEVFNLFGERFPDFILQSSLNSDVLSKMQAFYQKYWRDSYGAHLLDQALMEAIQVSDDFSSIHPHREHDMFAAGVVCGLIRGSIKQSSRYFMDADNDPLLQKMCAIDPKRRITASEALKYIALEKSGNLKKCIKKNDFLTFFNAYKPSGLGPSAEVQQLERMLSQLSEQDSIYKSDITEALNRTSFFRSSRGLLGHRALKLFENGETNDVRAKTNTDRLMVKLNTALK